MGKKILFTYLHSIWVPTFVMLLMFVGHVVFVKLSVTKMPTILWHLYSIAAWGIFITGMYQIFRGLFIRKLIIKGVVNLILYFTLHPYLNYLHVYSA